MLNSEEKKLLKIALKYRKIKLINDNDMKYIMSLAYGNAIERRVEKNINNFIIPYTNKIFKEALNIYGK